MDLGESMSAQDQDTGISSSMAQVLVSLVGTSPIPILLAHHDLRTDGMDHILVHSGGTILYAEAIQELTGSGCPKKIIHEKEPKACIDQLRQIRDSYPEGTIFHLNYTGGTKAMVAGGLVAFGQNRAGSWYLDESENKWHSLNGEVKPSSYEMSIDEIARLHGYSTIPSERVLSPSLEDLTAFLKTWWNIGGGFANQIPMNKSVLGKDASAISKLTESSSRKSFAKAIASGADPNLVRKTLELIARLPEIALKAFPNCDVSLLQGAVDRLQGQPWSALDHEHPDGAMVLDAATYLNGSCLEDLVIKGFEESGLLKDCKIHGSTIVHPLGKPDKFNHRELDICIIKPNGLIVVSVTACTDKKTVQRKMEEALTLVKEVGGYGAKAAVISGASARDLKILKMVNKVAANVRPSGCGTLKLLLEGKYKGFTQEALGGLI